MWNSKNFVKIICGLSLCIGVFAGATPAQGPLGQILDRLDIHNKALSSVRSDVTMVKHNSQLGVSDTYLGSTSYVPKTAKKAKGRMYVRLDWTKPAVEQISIIGEDYKLYKPSINQVYIGKVASAKKGPSVSGPLAFMHMSKEQLRANYTTRYIGEEQISGGIKTWHLELIPKSPTSYKSADLWVDGDGMPRQAKIVEQNNDTTTILLTNIQKNIKIKPDIFKLKYPSSVKEIKA